VTVCIVCVLQKIYTCAATGLITIYNRILTSSVYARKNMLTATMILFHGQDRRSYQRHDTGRIRKKGFYEPLKMATTGFSPRIFFTLNRMHPQKMSRFSEAIDKRGCAHPGSAMFGGVAGHAGLFSNAYDLAVLEQMLLNGGIINGQQFLKKATIDYSPRITATSAAEAWLDKPEKNNTSIKEPYPCISASPETFGHTGFTGTCVWLIRNTI